MIMCSAMVVGDWSDVSQMEGSMGAESGLSSLKL
jgi:hypothetical protein